MTIKEKFNLIWTAITLVGDGGCDPFTEEERKTMVDFLKELESKYGSNSSEKKI